MNESAVSKSVAVLSLHQCHLPVVKMKNLELQNSRFGPLQKHGHKPRQGALTCINHEGFARGQWLRDGVVSSHVHRKECMLSPGPGRLEPPRIEPFIRPRLQAGPTKPAAATMASPIPLLLIGASAARGQSRAFPNAVISRAPRSASSPLHRFHTFIRTAPSLLHQAACGAANHGQPGEAATRANPAVATRTQFRQSQAGVGDGGNDRSSTRCWRPGAHLGTPVGDWEDRSLKIGGRASTRQEFRVVLLRVGVCRHASTCQR